MPYFKLKQLQHESDTWKRVLGFMTDENIHLKNRLSEILQGHVDKDLLLEAEAFQNSFVREDDLIRFLLNDIVAFDKLLAKEVSKDGVIRSEMKKKLKSIRTNIGIAEKQFNKLKLDFNSYLLEYTSER